MVDIRAKVAATREWTYFAGPAFVVLAGVLLLPPVASGMPDASRFAPFVLWVGIALTCVWLWSLHAIASRSVPVPPELEGAVADGEQDEWQALSDRIDDERG